MSPAGLTKNSSGGRAARPSRLPGFRSRSSASRLQAGLAVARCAEQDEQPAAPVQPAAQRLHHPAVEALLRGVGPSRRDSDPPKPSEAPAEATAGIAGRASRGGAFGISTAAPAARAAASSVRFAPWVRLVACGAGRAAPRARRRPPIGSGVKPANGSAWRSGRGGRRASSTKAGREGRGGGSGICGSLIE